MKAEAVYRMNFDDEYYFVKNPDDFKKFVMKKMANDLANLLLEKGKIVEEEFSNPKHIPGIPIKTFRLSIQLPNTCCKECVNYDIDTNYCQFNHVYYPYNGFCSEGKPNNMKDSEQE